MQVFAEKDGFCGWMWWSGIVVVVVGSDEHHVGSERADISVSGLVEVVAKFSRQAWRRVGRR